MSFFEAKNITAGYGKKVILKELSFSVEKNSLTGILGANGCGKTTLIRAISSITPYTGEIFINGTSTKALNSSKMARLASYIPQRSGISIDISLLDVVLMGFNPVLGLLERPSKKMVERAIDAIRAVGLCGKENENYMTLSEGQKQLTVLARTLVSDAPLMLLDEPESALDLRHRYIMLSMIREWSEKGERCAIVTLHDPMLALEFCDKLIVMSDGRVETLYPKTDTLSHLEEALSKIYGTVTLSRIPDSSGKEHLVMLKNKEDII